MFNTTRLNWKNILPGLFVFGYIMFVVSVFVNILVLVLLVSALKF